jgi:hypothetical protein
MVTETVAPMEQSQIVSRAEQSPALCDSVVAFARQVRAKLDPEVKIRFHVEQSGAAVGRRPYWWAEVVA